VTKKTISQLPDIGTTQSSSAVCAIEQDGTTFSAPVRPNAPRERNYTSQAQIEADFDDSGDIVIPTDSDFTFFIDESFTLTKPILMGSTSSLEIKSGIGNVVITYTGTGAVIRNRTAGVDINRLRIDRVDFLGDGTNTFIDITTAFLQSVVIENSNINDFDDLGSIATTFADIRFVSSLPFNKGFKIKNPFICNLEDMTAAQQFANEDGTYISFLNDDGVTAGDIIINNVRLIDEAGGDTLIFFDPNSAVGTTYQITNSKVSFGSSFYQQGTDITVNSAVLGSSGAGFTNFTTAIAHGLRVGKCIVNSGFADSNYNGTFVVVSVDTPVTGTVYEVEALFTLTGTGTMNASSLDSTSPIVSAFNNPGEADSMFTAEAGLEIFGSEISSSNLGTDAFEEIQSGSWAYANLERFSIETSDEGELAATDIATRRYLISYSGTLEKSGGGSVNIGIVILKNGILEGFNPPHTVNTGKIQISGSDIVELTTGDTIQVGVINYDGTSAIILISQISLVIDLA